MPIFNRDQQDPNNLFKNFNLNSETFGEIKKSLFGNDPSASINYNNSASINYNNIREFFLRLNEADQQQFINLLTAERFSDETTSYLSIFLSSRQNRLQIFNNINPFDDRNPLDQFLMNFIITNPNDHNEHEENLHVPQEAASTPTKEKLIETLEEQLKTITLKVEEDPEKENLFYEEARKPEKQELKDYFCPISLSLISIPIKVVTSDGSPHHINGPSLKEILKTSNIYPTNRQRIKHLEYDKKFHEELIEKFNNFKKQTHETPFSPPPAPSPM